MAQITFKGKTYEVYDFVGVVAEASKHRDTHVHGSGGGSSNVWSGEIKDIKIESKTMVHDYFYLINDEGVERDFRVENCDIAIREGHTIQVIGVDNEPCVVVNNMTLNKVTWIGSKFELRGVFINSVKFIVSMVISIVVAAYFKSIVLFAVLFLITLFYLLYKTTTESIAFQKELQQFIK